MENAIDALYIGVAVLIFVVALSVSINAFGNARATSQAVLKTENMIIHIYKVIVQKE